MITPLSGQLTPIGRTRRVAFTPLAVSGLALWLKADTLALTDGASVATWPDSSGSGNDATQPVLVRQPIYRTNQQNGLPAVRFDGVSSVLTSPLARSQPYEVFAVCRPNATSGANQYLLDGSAPNTGIISFPGSAIPGDSCVMYAGTVLASTAAINSPLLIAAAFHGTSSRLAVNGASGTGDVGSSNTTGTDIGEAGGLAGAWLDGWIAELLIYSAALTDADRNRVTNYLNRKYLVY